MLAELHIQVKDSDQIKSLDDLGAAVCDIMSDVRKAKTEAKLSPKAPVGILYLDCDKPWATLDYQMKGVMPYDIMGACHAGELVIRNYNPPHGDQGYEELKRFNWDEVLRRRAANILNESLTN